MDLTPDIPNAPHYIYADAGWVSWGDWLGTGRRRSGWQPFKDARAFVRGLKLKTHKEWATYAKSKKKPDDIPSNPNVIYANDGWAGWGDWLGTGRRRKGDEEWRPFEAARAFVHRLKPKLKNQNQWFAYAKSGKKPHHIPYDPHSVYAGDGWVSWGDWLGTGRRQKGNEEWRSFKDARAFVHRLKPKLKNHKEWAAYCKSGKKPPTSRPPLTGFMPMTAG